MILSLALFAFEIVVTSVVTDDYKYSFFFWLDIIATLSLIPDIDWLSSPVIIFYGFENPHHAADATPGKIINYS
jgi:hypothetical protein